MIFTSTIVTAIAISTVTASSPFIATIAAGASFFYCSLY